MKRFTLIAALTIPLALVGCGPRTKSPQTMPQPSATDGQTQQSPTPSPDAGATGGDGTDAADQPKVVDLEPIRIEVVGRDNVGEPELDAFDARSLLDQGNEAMAEQRYDDAIARYEKLLAVFPDSRLASSAMYNIGLAHENKGEYDAAIARYRVLADDRSLDRDSIDAHLRIGGVQAHLSRWAEARSTLQAVLARTDLTHSDKLAAMARLGYTMLEQKDYTFAESVFRDAIAYYRKLTVTLDSDYFVAMSFYYLGQIAHRQFLAIEMRLPDEQLKKDLNAKAELVTLAYDRYRDVLKIYNVYWATAAGYQMSQIYKELWDDIVLAPIPEGLNPDARSYYVEEVHKRVQGYLQRAMNGHTKNVELADAYKTSTVWSDASRVRAAEIAQIFARESSGELVIPERRDRPVSSKPSTNRRDGYIPGRIEL